MQCRVGFKMGNLDLRSTGGADDSAAGVREFTGPRVQCAQRVSTEKYFRNLQSISSRVAPLWARTFTSIRSRCALRFVAPHAIFEARSAYSVVYALIC